MGNDGEHSTALHRLTENNTWKWKKHKYYVLCRELKFETLALSKQKH